MNKYCKDCLYWKPEPWTKKTDSGPMYGKCTHPKCQKDGFFHDHRQRRDGSGRMDWTAKHSNSRYRCHAACKTRFKEKEEK